MTPRPFYVIVDTLANCLVLVRTQDSTVEVVTRDAAAQVARALVGQGTDLGDNAQERVAELTLAGLAARLCNAPEHEVVSIVESMSTDTDFVDSGLCIVVTASGPGTDTVTIMRADR